MKTNMYCNKKGTKYKCMCTLQHINLQTVWSRTIKINKNFGRNEFAHRQGKYIY